MDFKPYKIGKYLLLERIASGGMAEVYRAKASGAGGFEKELAVKKILPSYSANEDFRRMFEYEARLSNKLTHANIVQIYDFVKPADSYLLAMEFVDGKNLRQLVNKVKKSNFILPIELSVYIINEVCKGLEYAHSKKDNITGKSLNIIHRDMSPQNIMISYEGAVKIVDFGIAKAKDRVDETRSGVIKGKFGYMSPEQANGESVDHRSDIFSTGIILYELITGRRLFATENDLATLKLIQECVIPVPSKINPKVTPELEKILLKALTKDIRLRYQTAGAFQKALQEYLNRNYSAFSSEEVSKLMRNVFAIEIQAEKKRFEQAHRQSIPFSQGETRTPQHESEEGIEEALDGDQTHSEIEVNTAVTYGEEEPEQPEVSLPTHQKDASTIAKGATIAEKSKSESVSSTLAKTPALSKSFEDVVEEESISKSMEEEEEASAKLEVSKIEDRILAAPTEKKFDMRKEFSEMATKVAKVTFDEQSGSYHVENSNAEHMPVLNQKTVVTAPEDNLFDSQEKTTGAVPKTDPKSLTPTRNRPTLGTRTPDPSGPKLKTFDSSFVMERAPDQLQTNSSTTSKNTSGLQLEKVGRGGAQGYSRSHNDIYGKQKRSTSLVPFLLIFSAIGITVYLYRLIFSRELLPVVAKIVSQRNITEAPKVSVLPIASPSLVTPAGDCLVRIDSDPPGAEVFINNAKRGITYLTSAVPCKKDINLELRLKGYEVVSENVFIQDTEQKILRSLKKIPIGFIELSLSQNADVYLDGLMMGRATANQGFVIELRAGRKHRLRLKNEVLGIDSISEVQVEEQVKRRMVLRLEENGRKPGSK